MLSPWDAAEAYDRALSKQTVSHWLEPDGNEVARHLSVNRVSPPAVTMIPLEQRARSERGSSEYLREESISGRGYGQCKDGGDRMLE